MTHPHAIGGYEIIEPIGHGSMGMVYKARDKTVPGRLVVIKLLAPELLDNELAVERFKREIRAAIQLEHPCFIQTYTAGKHEDSWFYVMEYVDGITIKKDLIKTGVYPEDKALHLTELLTDALEYAAGFNLVHRDIKPENIMILPDGRVKLCDMGLAKSTDTSNRLTMMGTVLGTPHYMSPEQAQGEDIDFRTDIYSLGATLFHMLTAVPPFDGEDPVKVITKLLTEEAPSPAEFSPDVSDGTCCVVAKMLTKKRAERYQSHADLKEDLRRARARERTEAEASGKIKVASRLPAKDFDYYFCNIPTDSDLLFGKIALRNKITTKQALLEGLDLQEQAAHYGALAPLGDIMLFKNLCKPAQKAAIDQARITYELEVAREGFLKAAVDNRFLTPKQMADARKAQRESNRELVPVLVEDGYIDEETRKIILGYQKQTQRQEEDRFFVKVAIENKFLTRKQAEKCALIQSNGVVMGKYRDLGRILVDKGFLMPRHKEVILRAIRRNFLTGVPIHELIESHRIPGSAVPRSYNTEEGEDLDASGGV